MAMKSAVAANGRMATIGCTNSSKGLKKCQIDDAVLCLHSVVLQGSGLGLDPDQAAFLGVEKEDVI